MEEAGLANGADFHLFLNPGSALPGDSLLLQLIFQLELISRDAEGFLLRFGRIKRLDKARFATAGT